MSSIAYLLFMVPFLTGIGQVNDHLPAAKKERTWAEKSVELPGGLKLNYVEQGSESGIPVLLLHGWTDSWNSFERVFPFLPESFHVFAPSLRGHGDSDKPLEGYHPRDFAADVAAFMDAVNIDSAVFAGFSMGGTVAKQFALSFPERVRGLIFIGVPVNLGEKPEIDELWELLLTLGDPIDPDFVRAFNEGVPVKPVPDEFMETINQANLKVPARVWRDAFKGVSDADKIHEYAKIAAPSLVLWGEHDSFTTLEDQQEIDSAIPDSELKVYYGNGHAVHWEEPEQFAVDVEEFVRKVSGEKQMR